MVKDCRFFSPLLNIDNTKPVTSVTRYYVIVCNIVISKMFMNLNVLFADKI